MFTVPVVAEVAPFNIYEYVNLFVSPVKDNESAALDITPSPSMLKPLPFLTLTAPTLDAVPTAIDISPASLKIKPFPGNTLTVPYDAYAVLDPGLAHNDFKLFQVGSLVDPFETNT